ncbi:hypothetical protein K443DRAFT_12131 [Laccaria amethystina LaAM-08-1]|uniref:Unplaced genomic scaffold K443scaffold_260, whole genome shotgun sequence n=1 Tax=Laccaria amethystina LaAM-08-1 TaxID=1095629 RepID=A0A0C9WZK5_9AGAR|nr:hypothetical protein K443DRAFT_12131 [Laccaria amethystina LaAM-08-1]
MPQAMALTVITQTHAQPKNAIWRRLEIRNDITHNRTTFQDACRHSKVTLQSLYNLKSRRAAEEDFYNAQAENGHESLPRAQHPQSSFRRRAQTLGSLGGPRYLAPTS